MCVEIFVLFMFVFIFRKEIEILSLEELYENYFCVMMFDVFINRWYGFDNIFFFG